MQCSKYGTAETTLLLLLQPPASAEGRDAAQNISLRNLSIKIGLPPFSCGQGNPVLFCLARIRINFLSISRKTGCWGWFWQNDEVHKPVNSSHVRSGTACQLCWHSALSPLPPSLWQVCCAISNLPKHPPGNVLIPVSGSLRHWLVMLASPFCSEMLLLETSTEMAK